MLCNKDQQHRDSLRTASSCGILLLHARAFDLTLVEQTHAGPGMISEIPFGLGQER